MILQINYVNKQIVNCLDLMDVVQLKINIENYETGKLSFPHKTKKTREMIVYFYYFFKAFLATLFICLNFIINWVVDQDRSCLYFGKFESYNYYGKLS